MSKSLKRVMAALRDANVETQIMETGVDTKTAAAAADVAGCDVDQIAKSIIFRVEGAEEVVLFLTAGGNQVDISKASALVNKELGKADAALIRKVTGFAIGGVSPVGHINQTQAFMDRRLMDFDEIWAAAGTPRHIFSAKPDEILRISSAQLADFTK